MFRSIPAARRRALLKIIFAAAFILICGILANAQSSSPSGAAPDFKAMLSKIDELNDFSGRDFTGVFTIVSEKPKEKQAVTQVRMFRRDAKEQFLMLLQLPEANKGQGYLKEGDNVWFYDPTSRKFNHSSMKEAINDSEARNNDFNRRKILEDYDIQKTAEGTVGKIPVWVITLKAKTNEVSYDLVRMHIRKDRPLIIKQEDLSVSARLMRTTLYPKYADVGGGKLFPSNMLLIDEVNVGEKSQITMTDLSTESLPDKVFTKAFLEAVN
ncbi:MAG: outer membrane lipoprotein-sorting protein [Treponemataceae bacterium]